MHLDNRTVAVVSSYVTLILGFLTAFIWRTRKTYPGFGRWTAGNLLAPLGLVLLSLRGFVPDWVSIVLANSLIMAASILFLEGCREFRGVRPRLISGYAAGLATMAVLIYSRYVVEAVNARIIAVSLCLGVITLGCAATLLRNRNDTARGSRASLVFTGAVFIVFGVLDVIRAIYFLNAAPMPGLFAPSLLNAVFFLNAAAASIAWSFGFLLLTNDRLVMELKDAEERANQMAARAAEADAAKSEFLAHMSHEIRTPLNGVIGMTNLVLDGPLNEAKRADLQTVQESAEALLAIINDVLDLAKIEAGHMTVKMAPLDLRRVLEQVVELFRPQAHANASSLNLRYPEDARRWFNGDELRLRQILCNLTANAVKFTSAGEIVVGMEELGTAVRVWVRDTGIGMDAEMLPRLFAKFSQVHGSRQQYAGTGLGLAISKKLAELMGGTMGVESEKGRGSTFWLDLPLVPVAAPPHGVSKDVGYAYDLNSLRLLVAEDNAVNRRLLVRMLERQGCGVDAASNGREALQFYDRAKYDIVLMDCQMPEMDGYEATRQIRMREKKSGGYTPIVAITANVMSGETERCREAGMDEYLSKPIDSALLRRCIHDMAARGRRTLSPVEETPVHTNEPARVHGGV